MPICEDCGQEVFSTRLMENGERLCEVCADTYIFHHSEIVPDCEPQEYEPKENTLLPDPLLLIKGKRLSALKLSVMRQDPQDGGLAQERNESQVCVCEPDHPGTPGRVHVYCGPAHDLDSIEEAQLFATAPEMLDALYYAYGVLNRDRGLSAHVDAALALIENVVGKALANVTFND